MKKETKMNVKKKAFAQKKSIPFGGIHAVSDIEGIGVVYSTALKKMGITDTKQLWQLNPNTISKEIGAPLIVVTSWQHMAELASIKDIGPQYSELLERSGIHNIEQLKKSKPNQLLKLINDKQKSLKINIQGNTPGHDLVENWIRQARNHCPT